MPQITPACKAGVRSSGASFSRANEAGDLFESIIFQTFNYGATTGTAPLPVIGEFSYLGG